MSGAAGEGLLGKGSWGRWRLRGPLRIEKIWIHRQAGEGIPGFGERLNIILEIGGQHGIWERGAMNEMGLAG